MKYREKCECCDRCHKYSVAYTHQINKPMILAFQAFIEKYFETKTYVKINEETLGIDHNQICNLQKMKYYGLMVRHEGEAWLPTKKGVAFYFGRAFVMTPAGSIDNEILPDDHPAWETHKKKRELKWIWDFDEEWKYKKRPEYQQEKSGQGMML